MGKPTRSPLLGYNHNVKYRGRIYHVQTEDSGPVNPHLFTHLYYEGTILATKRHEYDRESSDETVRGLMQGQHKSILKELRRGSFDDRLGAFFTARGEDFSLGDTSTIEGEETRREPIPTEVMAPLPEVVALDLDALPPGMGDTPPPEVVTRPPLPTGGPGIYAMKRASEEQPARQASGAREPTSSDRLLPLVVFDTGPPTPPPVAVRRPPSQAGGFNTPPPVTPPPISTPPPFPPAARASRPSVPSVPVGVSAPRVPPTAPAPTRPTIPVTVGPRVPGDNGGAGVVVQRQVVVGAPAPAHAPVTPRPRRPAQPIPYVVKEGTHAATAQPQSTPGPRQSSPPPPPRPLAPPASTAPRTIMSPASAPPPELISDKSLDEVILAYLSQGDGTKER